MDKEPVLVPEDTDDEIAALVLRLRATERRLRELTAGEVDAVLDSDGQSYLLREAQEKLRLSEATQREFSARQSSILNALPAHIALLDREGVIISVNEGWRKFAGANALQDSASAVGQNYLEVCERARHNRAKEAQKVITGIRSVMSGAIPRFVLEYPCHSPTEERWFELMVSPMDLDEPGGVVVMHINITERKLAESRLLRLNQLHAVLGKVGEAVARTRNRRELYDAVCRIVREEGKLHMVFIAEVDTKDQVARPVASYGEGRDYLCEPTSVIPLDGGPLSQGTVGTALRTGVPDFCNNIAGAARMQPWHETTQKYGLRANASFPFHLRGATIGVLVLYAGETGYFLDDEMRLMVSVASAISLALETLENERERQRAEEALRESEERLRLITNLVPHGIFAKDAAGRHIFANPALAEMAGLSVEQILGRTDYEMVPDKAQAEAYRADDLAVIQSGSKMVISEEPRTDFIGRTRLLQTIKIPFTLGKTGEPAVLGVCMDITERKQVENALRESEERFRSMFTAAATGIAISTPEGRFLEANAAYCRMVGYTEDELRTMDFASLTHAEDLPLNLKLRDELLAGQRQSFVMEKRYVKKNADIVWTRHSVSTVRGADGKISTMIVVAEDVTDRKRNEIRFRRLVDSNAQSVFFWNTQGAVTGANDAFLKLVGYTREELETGRIRWAEITPPEYAEIDQRAVKEVVSRGTCATYEKEFIRKDGTRVPILIGAAIFEDNREEGVGFLLDLTELKKVEAQFRQSQKMEGIGQLASGVAHDFNNILSAILGNAELARQDVGPDHPARESLEEIRKAGTRARDLVQQILAFSRQQHQERRVLALAPLIEEVVKLLRSTLPANVEVVVTAAPDSPNILADATQIHQVLLNLCTNAWHAMEGRAGRIDIGLRPLEVDSSPAQDGLPPGRYVYLAVRDDGKGMDAATLERIFDPFFTTKAPGEGTGLGMAVVHGIVKNHEAMITVASQPGRGTTFHLYFPAVDAPVEHPSTERESPKLISGLGLRVLYLDDEASLVFLGTRILKRLGYQVSGFTKAADALAAFKMDPDQYDLAVTDFNMPGMSGVEVARELLKLKPGLPVMLASGHLSEELKAEATAAGIAQLTYKPNTVEELGEAIHRMAARLKRP